MLNTNIKQLVLAITTVGCCLSLGHFSKADELTLETVTCGIEGTKISITVPMASQWTVKEKEKAGKSVCDSIKKIVATIPTPKESKAVCDTDYNCEVLWKRYHNYNIAKIFVADEERQRKGVHVIEVTCTKDSIIRYIAAEEELPFVCADPLLISKSLEAEAKETGETLEFQLNWKQLETLMNNNYIKPEKRSNHSPSARDTLAFMKVHPDAEVGGVFRNKEGTEKITLNGKACKEGTPCYADNYGLTITELTIRFSDADSMPPWFEEFCNNEESTKLIKENITSENSEEYLTGKLPKAERLTKGFFHCQW